MALPFNRILPLLILGLMIGSVTLRAQEDAAQWVDRSFVIAKSTTDYEEALRAAASASSTLDIRLDLRDLEPHPDNGLSWSADECEAGGWEAPCYVARGGYDNGVYVSIEYSSAYEGFAKGYYIVVIASGGKEARGVIQATLKQARKEYPDAYVKKSKVYVGCMH